MKYNELHIQKVLSLGSNLPSPSFNWVIENNFFPRNFNVLGGIKAEEALRNDFKIDYSSKILYPFILLLNGNDFHKFKN